MKSILNFYKALGKTVTSEMSKTSTTSLAPPKVTHWHTPGKLQYYNIEMMPHLSDEIKYGLRLPTRYAASTLKLSYLPKVEEVVMKTIRDKIKQDYFDPSRDLSMTLTLEEAEIMANAYPHVLKQAESGELQKMHDDFQATQELVEVEYLKVRDLLQRIRQEVEEKENEAYKKLREEGAVGLKMNGEASIFDTLALQTSNFTVENLIVADAFVQNNKDDLSSDVKGCVDTLLSCLEVKTRLADVEVSIQQSLLTHVLPNEQAALDELDEVANLRESLQTSLTQFQESHQISTADTSAYLSQIDEIESVKVAELDKLFIKFEMIRNERDRIYHNFLTGTKQEYLDTFRQQLLQDLAGAIVVKESRHRYQKEQYERFIATSMDPSLKRSSNTIAEFCAYYAMSIETLIEESHNGRSPKIEASYDDFGERTSRPINATIFYYFFSLDKRRRTIARWLLSTARYPNERIWKAYTRFFA